MDVDEDELTATCNNATCLITEFRVLTESEPVIVSDEIWEIEKLVRMIDRDGMTKEARDDLTTAYADLKSLRTAVTK